MLSQRQSILILILVSLLTFSNALGNGFVGDDHMLLVKNSFFQSWSNLPKLFNSAYMAQPDTVFNAETFSHTGSVAFRPVLSLSYFFDYSIWRSNPFGYHLTNVLVHVLNTICVYLILVAILRKTPLALWSAVLFAVHPAKTEAVAAIGYRADVLACLFFLLAFLGYIYRTHPGATKRPFVAALSHIAFFLALFTKESAVVFVGILAVYDWLIGQERPREVLKHFCGRYLGYVLITFFYLYVYLFVFRNSALDDVPVLGGTVASHILTSLQIFFEYLSGFIFPFTVKTLPPYYVPPFDVYRSAPALLVFVVFVLAAYRVGRKDRTTAFFLLWFLISLVPVSNIIPLVHPVAYRFMYLPSVGFLTALMLILDKFQGFYFVRVLRTGVIVLCVIMAFSLNMAWRNNFLNAFMMVKDFPKSPTGYLYLGMEYLNKGDFASAEATLQKGLTLGLSDPRAYHFLALCYFHDWDRAAPYYEKSIRLFPRYALSYVGLGRIYVLSGRYAEAVLHLEQAVALSPSYAGYGYLIQSYLRLDRPQDAVLVYQEAREKIKDKSQLDSLKRFIEEGRNLKEAVDIGI